MFSRPYCYVAHKVLTPMSVPAKKNFKAFKAHWTDHHFWKMFGLNVAIEQDNKSFFLN